MSKLTSVADLNDGTDQNSPSSGTEVVKITCRGGSASFVTSSCGYTQFHMWTEIESEGAEIVMTWVENKRTPKFHEMTLARPGASTWFMDTFEGSRITITNHSASADIFVKVSADAD